MPSDFSGQNLRGCFFRDQDLTDADFSYADIRGADFTNAVLRGANFSNAQAGLPPLRQLRLFIALFVVLAVIGLLATLTHALLLMPRIDPEGTGGTYSYIVIVLSLIICFVFLVLRGYIEALLISIAIGVCLGAIACVITGTVALAIAGGITVAVAGVGIGVAATAIAVADFVGGKPTRIGAIAALLAFVALGTALGAGGSGTDIIIGSMVANEAGASVAAYLGWQAAARENKQYHIRNLSIVFAAIGGTSFREADLTDADFARTTLQNTDFRSAKLIHTNFHKAKQLLLSRVGNTILVSPDIRELVVTHRGANQFYVGLNLKGIYLAGADLSGADLTEADLSDATFEGAWLERANLTKAQALNTNFNRARLTAACLEAWNIDSSTQLEGAICQYVYLRNGQQERRPSSGEFAPGEFTKLFQEVINTVDLIFRNGIDWKAFHYSFHQLQVENEDVALSIRSIENKGDGVVVVRVDAPIEADKAQLHADFTQTYNLALQALEEKYRAELKSKDEQIAIYRQHQADLHQLAQLLASRPVSLSSEMLAASATQATGKRVVLKLGQGNLASGFPVILQIGPEASLPSLELSGQLAAVPELTQDYRAWQAAYYQSLQANFRLDIPDTQITNVSRREFFQDCHEAAEQLRKQLNLWLNSEIFRPIKEQLLEQLDRTEPIRFILQTEDPQLRLLPLQLWDFFERYSKAELALATSTYERVNHRLTPSHKVKILAILGDSTGINVQKDRTLLAQLPEAEVTFLVEPQRQEVSDHLWAQPWDILFFAGHSSSEKPANLSRSSSQKASASIQSGYIHLNKNDRLTIPQLKHALRKAIAQGLQLAIFNSCDGLGLASDLADLHIPQMIVMREPVPDRVAQEFLKNFLSSFSAGTALYQAVREAREKLQGLEDQFPCATWLPVICQNPAVTPLTWRNLING